MRSDKSAYLSCVASRYQDFYLTNKSSMFGCYELGGVDPTGLGENEKVLSTALLRSLIRNSPPELTLTQYYIHQYDDSVSLRPRNYERSSVVSKRRELFLKNKRRMCRSNIYFLPELPFAHDLTSFVNFDFIHNLISFPVSKEARNYIKTRFSERNSILAYEDDIKETSNNLTEEIEMHLSRLDLTSFNNKILNAESLWGLIKALHNFDFELLGMGGKPASNNLNSRLFESDITPVMKHGVDYLKFSGVKPVYVRIASIKGISDEYIDEALLAKDKNAPLSVIGNYVFMTRYRGFNRAKQNKYFKNVQNEVQRNQINTMDLVTGKIKSALEQQMMMSDKDKSILDEVQHAITLADYHGNFESSVAVFGHDVKEIDQTCKDLRASLNQAGVDIVWEVAGLDAALESFLPGSQFESKRVMVINSTKAAALSLYYKSNTGVPEWEYTTVEGNKKEESFYIFESNDGVPFYYTPFIGGRCMVIGVGPVRSGKTFKKNTIATNIMKYTNSIYTAVDIDPGTEAIAKFFKEDGAIFRLDDDFDAGFNPFSVAKGPGDYRFKAHFIRQIETMIRSNSNNDIQRFTRHEQILIDNALSATLDLPNKMQNFSSFIDHCNNDIKFKLSRFVGNGMYARIYDNAEDAIGSLSKRFIVYNIMGVKNDSVALPLVMNEIVYRVLRTFEDPNTRDLLKMFDVDEAHQFLAIPGMTDFLVRGARTWGKFTAGVSLWTQSPVELGRIPDWPALRSAASTFWFMADGEMDRDVYRGVFNLSDGHLDAIGSLIPKQQAFIYQPDIHVAKIVNLFAEPEQRIINTSVAGETMVLGRNIEMYGKDIDQAIQKTIKDLNFV